MLKFARRRARSSEREPRKSAGVSSSDICARVRSSSEERLSSRVSVTPGLRSPGRVTVEGMVEGHLEAPVEARIASIQKAGGFRMFVDADTDLAVRQVTATCPNPQSEDYDSVYSCAVATKRTGPTFAPMTSTLSQLTHIIGQVKIGEPDSPPVTTDTPATESSSQSSSSSIKNTPYAALNHPPPVLPRKPKIDNFLQHRKLWKMELLDTSAESGYGTDSSDNNSLKSSTESSPPPLPKRKPKRRVQFDSYVLLIQSLKERDLPGILSTIFNVSTEALCTEDIIYHFHTAILRQDYEVTELLVRGGCEVNTFDHRGWSALHCACRVTRLDIVKLLLQNGAAVLARTHHTGQVASQLLSPEQPAYPACLAYMRCMEECLGTVNNRLVTAAATYRSCRIDEITVTKGERMAVIRRGDVNNEMWWWVQNARGNQGYVLRDLLALNCRQAT